MSERDYLAAQGEAEQQERRLTDACVREMESRNLSRDAAEELWELWFDLPHEQRWEAMMAFCGSRYSQLS